MNAKGGMDDVEFDGYLYNSLIPLYLDAEDVKGNRVIFNLGSGPGRMVVKLLAWLCLLGFVLYPGVPNNTAVSQETHRSYGPFKTAFRIILDEIFQERMLKKRKLYSIRGLFFYLYLVGWIRILELVRKNIFQEGFSKVQCIKAWDKIGAEPMTRACLSDKQV